MMGCRADAGRPWPSPAPGTRSFRASRYPIAPGRRRACSISNAGAVLAISTVWTLLLQAAPQQQAVYLVIIHHQQRPVLLLAMTQLLQPQLHKGIIPDKRLHFGGCAFPDYARGPSFEFLRQPAKASAPKCFAGGLDRNGRLPERARNPCPASASWSLASNCGASSK